MIELSRHIESLLLDNDCVIVPELGGFIAHYQSAYYVEEERIFIPPTRKVGFNPQLTMNDGLLAQSYMQVYHMDYSDAMNRISENVNALKDALYKGETVELHGIGALHYNIYDEYEFQSTESGLLSPALYGLDAFSMPLLSNELPLEEQVIEQSQLNTLNQKKEIRLNPARWLGNAVAVAAAVILFFVLSIPVENTYIDKGSYASLGTDCLFDAIRSQSMVTFLSEPADEPQMSSNKDLKPRVVKVEKVAPAVVVDSVKANETVSQPKPIKTVTVQPKVNVKAEQPKKTVDVAVAKPKPVQNKSVVKKNKYHIIVASLPTSADAQRMLKEYNQQGYRGASVIEGNGRFRIALCSYSDKTEAYGKLNSLKKVETFKDAWMLSSK